MTFGTIDQTNSTYWVSRRVKRATSMKMKNSAGLFHIWTQRGHHTAGLSFPAARYQTHLLHYRHTPHLYFCVQNLKGKWTQYNNVSMLITRSLIFFCARVLQVHTRCILARCDLMQEVLFSRWCVINVDIVGCWTCTIVQYTMCADWYYQCGQYVLELYYCVPTGIIQVDVGVLAGQSLHTDANAVIALLAICLELDEHHDHHRHHHHHRHRHNYLKAIMQLFNIFVLLSDQQKKVDGEVIRRIQTILKTVSAYLKTEIQI